ncbi:MAG: molybdenum cofactor guanylyltransferase [Planctomycetota bacterium]|nr:MAG: molybdenum cofactor guanylyltransferase [Planctomycetota bacterium]
MIQVPGMLMVGAMARGAGRTKLACSLIERFSSECSIIGIKVTTVEDAESGCPRGESECVVCSSLQGEYEIIEETDAESDKDTCRMLASGAGRVFWLRALRPHLEEGIGKLLEIMGGDAISVCETNSLRRVVEPGLFVMVERKGSEEHKASAKDVVGYADRIVIFDGNEFDMGIDEVELADGRWTCKLKATAIIMAGGESVRMGRDKSMLPVGGRSMIEHIANQIRPHFDQVLISADDKAKYGFLGVDVISDEVSGRGPLGGIASALKASANELNFVVACDIPEIDMARVKTMLRQGRENDAVVPRSGAAEYEPLFAVYKKGILGAIESALLSGNYRIMDALNSCRIKYVDVENSEWMKNLNTVEDYEEFVGHRDDDSV